MVAYLAACWTGERPDQVAALCAGVVADPDWRLALEAEGLVLLVRGPVWPRVRALPAGRGWVVGDVFRRSFRGPVGAVIDHLRVALATSAMAIATDLRDQVWGRYVALIDPGRDEAAVFRDPSGAADALLWQAGGLRFVGSHLPDGLPVWAWPDLSFDWAAIARWLETPSAAAVQSGLVGVQSVTPGALARWAGGEVQVWRPADYATAEIGDASEAARALPGLLDACVGALVADCPAILAEVSGGLDSAIVASSLAPRAGARVRAWFNNRGPDGSGNELSFARQVAELWGFSLAEVVKSPLVFTAEAVEAGAQGLRPGFQALDVARDRDGAAMIRALGVERLVTGQGGDMVFFNTPTPVLAVDHLRQVGLWRALTSPYLAELAAWTRTSVWRTWAVALNPRAAWPSEATVSEHGWMQGAASLPPGKRCHIALLAQKLTVHIENQRSRWAEVVHPLLSQPLVEHCLAIPTPDLTLGCRDRGLARLAFAERLPPAIRVRREKGEFATYYGRAVAAGLPVLRPYLLEGRLAAEGLLDRPRFEALLTPEALIWRGESFPIMAAVTVEAWLRVWAAKAARAVPGSGPASRG